jgi:demethylmenaquinone methyltransferase/2-methoxy-6-polyprenyl-1,4-benzoquinol methylase
VAFVDDSFRSPRELVEGEQSSTIRRWLTDGTEFRAVKVPHAPARLTRRLEALGWSVDVTPLHGPFYIGVGSRASSTAPGRTSI